MKNSNKERKMIFEDQEKFNNIIHPLPVIYNGISQVKEGYESLEIGGFDNLVYQDLIANGFADIEKRYNDNLNTSLAALGAINTKIRANLLADTDKVLDRFKTAVISLNQSNHPFPLNLISIVDGLPILNDSGLEEIKERFCRVYIQTEAEFELYNNLQALSTAYNQTLKSFDKVGYLRFFDMSMLNEFLTENQNTKETTVKPYSISNAMDADNSFRKARQF